MRVFDSFEGGVRVVASAIAIVVLMVVEVVLKLGGVEFGFGFVHRRIVYLEIEIETDSNRKKERMK